MSVGVTFVQVSIPTSDVNGGDTFGTFHSFAASVAALTSDKGFVMSNGARYDQTDAYLGGVYVATFFLLSANNAAALALYTTYKNSLPSGTSINIVYSSSTLGV